MPGRLSSVRPTFRLPPPPVASHPGDHVEPLCRGQTDLAALHSTTAALRSSFETSQNWRRCGKVRSLANFPPPNQIGAAHPWS
jgi:hypothetical protein